MLLEMLRQLLAVVEVLRDDKAVADLIDTLVVDNKTVPAVLGDNMGEVLPNTKAVIVQLTGGSQQESMARYADYVFNIYSCGGTLLEAADIDDQVHELLQYNTGLQGNGQVIYKSRLASGPSMANMLAVSGLNQQPWINVRRTYVMTISNQLRGD